MTNNDDWMSGSVWSVERLARMVLEAAKSEDPDVLAALVNLDEVIQRSKVREIMANKNKVRAPRTR